MADFITVEVLADIIQHELGLPSGSVQIYNQRNVLPKNQDLFISVSMMGSRPFGNSVDYEPRADGLWEKQKMNAQETIGIDVLSHRKAALVRCHEVAMAMRSTYAQQMQEKYGFHIGAIPSTFNNVSDLETTAMLNRFSITFQCLRAYGKERLVQSYNQFPGPDLLINK